MHFTNPEFQLGPLKIQADDLVIILAFIVALGFAFWRARRRGIPLLNLIYNLPFWGLMSLAGARLYHVLTPSTSMVARGWTTDYYLSHWLEAIFFAQGGFGFLGAIAGLCIGIFLVNWRKSTGFWTWMDCLTPPILASMVIGRWADAFNNILYGQPTLNTQWAVYIEPEFRLVGFEQFDYFQPLFLYESLGAFLLLILILFIERDQKWDWLGRTAMIGLGGYAGLRFFLEYLRIDISLIGTKNINQLIVGWLFVGASVVVLRNLFVLRQLSAYQRLHR